METAAQNALRKDGSVAGSLSVSSKTRDHALNADTKAIGPTSAEVAVEHEQMCVPVGNQEATGVHLHLKLWAVGGLHPMMMVDIAGKEVNQAKASLQGYCTTGDTLDWEELPQNPVPPASTSHHLGRRSWLSQVEK